MNMRETADLIAKTLSDRKARDITIIDISAKSSFADYFVNATAGSSRQLGALTQEVEEKLAGLALLPKSIDGRPDTGWMLMDYGDIIVNVFNAETREKYALDKIWGDCDIVKFED